MTDSTSLSIPFSSIIVGDRYRKNYGDLSGLKHSLQTYGSIHSIVLSRRPNLDPSLDEYDSSFDLIAGGRRYAAMKELGVTTLHHNKIITPGFYSFCFQDEVPEDLQKELELDENFHNLRTSWIEEVLAISDIHNIKRRQQKSGVWGQRHTSDLLGKGFKIRTINYALRAAKAIRDGDEEIMSCPHLTAAIQVFAKRKEDEALEEATKRAASKLNRRKTEVVEHKVEVVEGETTLPSNPLSPAESLQSVNNTITIPLSAMFQNADTLTALWPMCDHIVTDIPYGIDMKNINMDMLNSNFTVDVEQQHDIDQNVSMMKAFLTKAFAAVKDAGFCVFFYDLDHHEKLLSWATEIGWKPQRWPYIACKSSYMPNQSPQYNLTKKHETCMFLRKPNATLRKPGVGHSFGIYDFAEDRAKYNNPFAKPFTLWKFIYEAIAFPGQTVFDPYAGERSGGLAAIKLGLIPYGIELSPQHHNRGDNHMRELYTSIHSGPVDFI